MEHFAAAVIVSMSLASIVFAALCVAVVGLLQYRLVGLVSADVRVAATLAIVAMGALLSVALTSRTLDEVQRASIEFIAYDDYAQGFAASRWLSLLLIGAAFVEIVRGALAAHVSIRPDPALPLLWGALAYFFGTLLVQGVASDHTGFSHKDLYLPIALVAVYYQRIERIGIVLDAAKWTLFALTAGSLLAAVVSPDFALHRPDPGIIPGIDWRLFGLTEHANTLGPPALVAILLELYRPSPRPSLRVAHLGAAFAVFVLAQSRTAWAAAAAIVLFVVVPLSLRSAGTPAAQAVAFRRAVWTMLTCIAAVLVLMFGLASYGAADHLQRTLELMTLHGRFQIWEITLQAWRENPVFGYGSEIWGVDRQYRFHMFHVGHAHNQIVQTLGESGLAGLALLLSYLGMLLRAALRRFVASRGILLALLLVLFARCITEAPMRAEGLLTWSSFLHVLIVVLACHSLRGSVSLAPAPADADGEHARIGGDCPLPPRRSFSA